MGLLDSITNFFGGGGSQVGTPAASQANIFSQKAIDELRRQFDVSREDISPFVEAGIGSLGQVVQGTTPTGLDERLGEIFGTETFQNLVGERQRAVEGQLGAAGLTRSGTALQEAANIPTDIGLAIEGLLSNRAANLAGTGQTAALGGAQLGAGASTNIANLLQQQGQNVASGILTDAQAQAAGAQNLVNLTTTAAGIFFSDPALKENIQVISQIGDLQLYRWDWIAGATGTMIEKCGTTGFMADEVQEKYPQHVGEFCGLMVIDYPALLSELEAG
jgi:hypothetical protein